MSESVFDNARRVVIVVCPECKRSFVTRSAQRQKPCSECGELPPEAAGEETHQG